MIRPLCLLLSVTAAAQAVADGLPLQGGRYAGEVIVFSLTPAQKQRIDHFRKCHVANASTMNVYTPYVFQLTSEQAKGVARRVGYSPRYFQVYETFRGFNDPGPHWNLALRFNEDEIEVPVKLLLPALNTQAEFKMQGWKATNPCFPDVTP